MVEYLAQKKCFIEGIEKIKNVGCLNEIILSKINEWVYIDGKEKGAFHFPNYIEVEYKIEGKSDITIQVQIEHECLAFCKVEIVSIDSKERYRNQGNARKLVKQAELIAKEFDAVVWGTYMDGARGFYEKCGYSIENNKFRKSAIDICKENSVCNISTSRNSKNKFC